MSSDWFEEALSELDEEVDEGDVDRETLEEELDADTEDDDTAAVESSADEAASTDETESTNEFEAGSEMGAQSSSTAQSPEEFGFDSEELADQPQPDESTESPEEFNADTDGEGSDPFGFDSDDEADGDEQSGSDDPFGFGGDDAAAGGEASSHEVPDVSTDDADDDTDDNTDSDDDEPTAASEESQPQSASTAEPDGPGGSSTAQSPEEFGFSIDDEATATGNTDAGTPTPEPETASAGSDAAIPEPEAAAPEPDDGVDNEDPFGFGSSSGGDIGDGAGGQGMGQSGDDDFGFGGFGGGGGGAGGGPAPSGPEEFDDEDFDSDIDRIDLGIEGLDNMILGGVPERSLIGIIGGAGTGKTTFGLQFLNEALKNGELAVFITLEQTEEAVLSTAEEKGWPFREYADTGQLAVVVLDPVEMANSLASIRSDISRLIREFGASRLVLDSVSLLEMMYDHPARRRSEVFDFTRSLKEAGVTTLLTSEASEDSSHASRYGAVEYLTDAVFILQYVRTSNFEETRLAIEIQKIRDANHSRATKPYDLTDEGMSVHRQANIF